MEALRCNDQGVNLLVAVSILELDLGDGGTTPLVVDNSLHNALGVSVALSIVRLLEADSSLTTTGVGLENRALAATAAANDLSHVK